MRKLIFLTTCTALFACTILSAYAKSDKTTITGRLEGLKEGARITLVPGGTHMAEDPVAETTVTNGGFVIETTIEEPRLFYIRAEGVREGIGIIAAPGDKVNVSGTFAEPVITGSKLQEEYDRKYVKPRAAMNKLHSDNQQKYAEIARKMGEARQNNDEKAVAEIIAGDEWKAYNKADADFFKYIGAEIDKIIRGNSDTYWGPLLLMTHTAYLSPENERHYDMFSEEAKNSFYGKAVAAELFGITGAALAFAAKDADAVEYSLKSLLTGNNYVLIDFWASWCGPCRKFVPTLKELAAKYADKGLVVVSISTDTDRKAWLKAMEEEKMPWLNLLDESNISKVYGVSAIPSLFLIDPDGNIIFGKQSGQSVVDKLAKVFEK